MNSTFLKDPTSQFLIGLCSVPLDFFVCVRVSFYLTHFHLSCISVLVTPTAFFSYKVYFMIFNQQTKFRFIHFFVWMVPSWLRLCSTKCNFLSFIGLFWDFSQTKEHLYSRRWTDGFSINAKVSMVIKWGKSGFSVRAPLCPSIAFSKAQVLSVFRAGWN